MSPAGLISREDLKRLPIRLAEPDELDPEQVPYFSIWTRTDDDPDPLDSPVLDAYEAFVDEVAGFEDAFWTVLHWASGEAPTTAAVPAPPGETRRVYVWRDDAPFAVTVDPAKGIRIQFPPYASVEDRVEFLRHLTRVVAGLKRTDLADAFRDPVIDYRTREGLEEMRSNVAGEDDPIGAVGLFFTVEQPE